MMKPKTYLILSECIERGIDRGWNRAYKHDENPSEDHIKNQIYEYVINEICEYFDFPSNHGEVDEI